MLGEEGIYDCNVPARFRTLTTMSAGRGYWVHITNTQAVNLIIEGVPLAADTPLPQHTGWNWDGYLPASSKLVTDALSSIAGGFIRVSSVNQFYDVTLPPGFNSLSQLSPGLGYRIYMSVPLTLAYPAMLLARAASTDEPAPEEYALERNLAGDRCAAVRATPDAMPLYGVARLGASLAPAGSLVEALTPAGAVVGCARVGADGQFGAMLLYGADELGGIAGFHAGDAVRLRINGRTVLTSVAWQNELSPRRANPTVFTIALPMVANGE